MKRFFLFAIFLLTILTVLLPQAVISQSDTQATEESLSIEEQVDKLLGDLSSLQKSLKKNRRKRPVATKIRLISKNIIKGVNSIPPDNCMKILRKAMDDFYKLVSDLGLGISCGPPILPPFLPGDDLAVETLNSDCLPPSDEPLERFQIGGPFGGSFADVYPLYNEARDLFQIDTNNSKISDACE